MDMENKYDLRQQIKAQKQQLSDAQIEGYSQKVGKKYCNTEWYQKAELFFAYASFNEEIRTKDILKRALQDHKIVALPKIEKGQMIFYSIRDLEELVPNRIGIPEPVGHPRNRIKKSCFINTVVEILLPGLAFDRVGGRIGYGGGYYDRFLFELLEKEKSALTVHTTALAYEFQIVERVPMEEQDRRIDTVITEKEIISIPVGR